jgi:acyl dehydratase
MPGRSLDEIRVGDAYREEVALSAERVEAFCALTGDFTGVHVAGGETAEWGYDRPIVHGLLVSSFFSRILGSELPGARCVIGSVSFQYHAPLFVGEAARFGALVRRVVPPLRSVQLDLSVDNADGVRCVSGKATCIYPK